MQATLKNQTVRHTHFSGTLCHHNPAANIWEALLAELYDLGFSHKTIAEASHISIPTLKRLEKNRVHPTPATFSKLLAFYCSVATAA